MTSTNSGQRQRLISLAYGYLGTLAEAEDIVQEALLRLEQSGRSQIQNKEAWLTTVVSRLAIDKLRSAQHRREVYPGEWLPEPVYLAPSQEQEAITRTRLSIGLLYLLEILEPEQRIVFVLREVFEHSYQSIANIAGKSEAACRQLMVRARAALDRSKRQVQNQEKISAELVNRFIAALNNGNEKELLHILADDAVLIGDGGGKAPSILNPVFGADRIARFFTGIRRKPGSVFVVESALVNSSLGFLTYRDGELASVASVEVNDGRISAIYSVSNPDKLAAKAPSPAVDSTVIT